MTRRARAFPPPIATGILIGVDPNDEASHYFSCEECGHMVDMRNLGEVLEHEGPHKAPAAS